jgi:hypothetical protein
MAVGISMRWDVGSAKQYDAVNDAVDVHGNPPDGLLVHSAGPVHDGWGVTDFWESREQYDAFIKDRLMAVMQTVDDGLGQPDVREFPVHNLEVYAGA